MRFAFFRPNDHHEEYFRKHSREDTPCFLGRSEKPYGLVPLPESFGSEEWGGTHSARLIVDFFERSDEKDPMSGQFL